MKVFGIGMMKTGTSTLGHCFWRMGFNHRPYYPKLLRQMHKGDFSYVWDVVKRYDSFEDNPWPLLYKEIDERYPDSKFILTERKNSEVWFRSIEKHAKRRGPTPERDIIYGSTWPSKNKQDYIAQYEAHSQEVKSYFSDRPDKLMLVCWETGTSWQDISVFLNYEGDEISIPNANSSKGRSTNWRAWARNTTKYITISKLGIDPYLYRNLNA